MRRLEAPRMTRIYRVEHMIYGHGPYRDGHDRWHRPSALWRHPFPEDDFAADALARANPVTHCFGFISLRQLSMWFTAAEQRRLSKHDFGVAIYDIPDNAVVIGCSQVCFQRWMYEKTGYVDWPVHAYSPSLLRRRWHRARMRIDLAQASKPVVGATRQPS
jgi:hypothetical protein